MNQPFAGEAARVGKSPLMTEELPSVFLLTVMAVVALWLTVSRGGVTARADAVRAAVRVTVIAIVAQAGHFANSPLMAVVGILLLMRLFRVTERPDTR